MVFSGLIIPQISYNKICLSHNNLSDFELQLNKIIIKIEELITYHNYIYFQKKKIINTTYMCKKISSLNLLDFIYQNSIEFLNIDLNINHGFSFNEIKNTNLINDIKNWITKLNDNIIVSYLKMIMFEKKNNYQKPSKPIFILLSLENY